MSELKFTVSYGRTVNLMHYEIARFGLSMEFPRDEMPIDEAFELVKAEVEKQIKKLWEARGVEKEGKSTPMV